MLRLIKSHWHLALVISILGCGDGSGRVSVTGVVELDGKPLDGAAVAFVGNGGGALASASTNKDGKFIIKAAPGPNKVSISKVDPASVNPTPAKPARPEDMLMGPVDQVAKQIKKMKLSVPAKYSSPESSGITFDVSSGMQPIDISLISD